jgi:hypothetical protein
MAISIADLRKSRTSDFSKLTKALDKTADYSKDEGDFFKLTKDKAGNGSAVIRFLPKHPDDDLPFVTVYSHAFKGPTGRWYIENSRTTLGESDPISEFNRQLWASGSEKDKSQARDQKRKTSYIANVLVISDPANPDNNGKVMRFKFGKKIFQMIADKAKPTFAEDKPVDVFDAWEGAEFKLRMRQVEGYPNYDTSVFSDPKPLASTDEDIIEIVNQMKPLNEFLAASQFKSYEELEKKFQAVMNGKVVSTARAEEIAEQMRSEPVAEAKVTTRVVAEKASKKDVLPFVDASADEDDVEAYFKSIAD